MSKGGDLPLAARAKQYVDNMRSAVVKNTPKVHGESDNDFGLRLKNRLKSALSKMHRNQYRSLHGTSKYLPHQGGTECSRRVLQLSRGQIFNYDKAQPYRRMG